MVEEVDAAAPKTLLEAFMETARTHVVVRYELTTDRFGRRVFVAECITAPGLPGRAPDCLVHATLTAEAVGNQLCVNGPAINHYEGARAYSQVDAISESWFARADEYDKASRMTFLSAKTFAGVLVKEHFDLTAPTTTLQLPATSPIFQFYTGIVLGALQATIGARTVEATSRREKYQVPGLERLVERFGAFAHQNNERNVEHILAI